MTKHIFQWQNNLQMTSIVMDEYEFNEFVDQLRGVRMVNKDCNPATENNLQTFRQAGHFPLMSRGTKTQAIFERYDVKTDYLSAIVRGKGHEVAAAAMGYRAGSIHPSAVEGVVNVSHELAIAVQSAIFSLSPIAAQEAVSQIAELVFNEISQGRNIEQAVLWWHKRLARDVNRQFWEKLASDSVICIGMVLDNFTKAGIGSDVFKGYLVRLFANNLFCIDCHRANGLPDYVTKNPAAASVLASALQMVGLTYGEWVDLHKIKTNNPI